MKTNCFAFGDGIVNHDRHVLTCELALRIVDFDAIEGLDSKRAFVSQDGWAHCQNTHRYVRAINAVVFVYVVNGFVTGAL